MLQYITNDTDLYNIAEEVQMAIDGGCRWVQLRMKEATDDEVREVAAEIIPMCQENDVFLIIDDRVELVNELRVSGVHLGKEDMDPLEARELLGPHAIIGITANTADDIIRYKGKDIDYVGLGPVHFTTTKKRLAPELGYEGVRDVVARVREAGVEFPIVAIGGLTLDDVKPLMEAGVNGIAVSGDIVNAPEPSIRTAEFIERLNNYNS